MINNDIARVVENEVSARRSACRKIAEEKRALLQKRCPRVLEIEREINSSALDFAQRIMAAEGGAEAMEAAAREALASKRKEETELLLLAGLPADYLGEPHICPVCRDTGYVSGALCRCMRQAVIDSCFAGSGIDPNESFENFRFDLLKDKKQQSAIRKIYDFCLDYADSFPNIQHEDLLLYGLPGVGKTFLLNCIAGRILGRGFSVLKLTSNRLIQTVVDSLRLSPEERPDYSMSDLLVIDDLGTEPMLNNITIETLLSIIVERQNAHKSVIIATNLNEAQLYESYGERIVSRLFAPRTVKAIEISTDDVRFAK